MNLAAIFQVLEHLNGFEKLSMAAILFFKKRAKLFKGKTFVAQDFPRAVLHFEALGNNNKGDIRIF